MLTILLHSSKTMRVSASVNGSPQTPALLPLANELARYLQALSSKQLQTSMKLSAPMAMKTHELIANWRDAPENTLPAIDAFIGDIYSGLQVQSLTDDDRAYANDHLYILSGLYGVLRALDSVQSYRLEMGYRLPDEPYRNLYGYWGDRIAAQLPIDTDIVNLSAVEYTKAVFPHLPNRRIITPKFLTISPKSREPTFVTVHAKIARGAFAHWLITNHVASIDALTGFDELNYRYDKALSTPDQPVFVCEIFGGIGMSIRLT